MPLILAIEPDRHQASQLTAIVRGRLHAELVLEATAERALAELGDRVPDLILTAALLSPKDEAALAGRLRALESAAAHIHTITIPALAAPRVRARIGGMLSALRRDKSQASEPDGCDPAVFAEQCATYLERAMAERKELAGAADEEPASVEEPILEQVFEAPVLEETAGWPAELAIEQPVVEQIADEPPAEDAIEEPLVEEAPGDLSIGAAGDAPLADETDDTIVTPIAEQPVNELVSEEMLAEPAAEEPVIEEAVAADPVIDEMPVTFVEHAGTIGTDHLLDEAPLFELVTEAEAESDLDLALSDLDNAEDLDRYIELDLSEFLDQAAPTVHAVAGSLNDAPAPGESDVATPGWSRPDGGRSTSDSVQVAARKPEQAPADSDEADWLDVVAGLRRDVERLDATPMAPVKAPKPLKKAVRRVLKGKPIQDEWGFFDPEQCGFAALLAKLDEVTNDTQNPARPRKPA